MNTHPTSSSDTKIIPLMLHTSSWCRVYVMTELRLVVYGAVPDYIREIFTVFSKRNAIFAEFEYLARDSSVWRSWSHLPQRRLIILVHKFHATLIPPNSEANVIKRDASLAILLVIFAM
jgi:hypothetical protein